MSDCLGFDIFSGFPEENATRIETIEGFVNALEKMEKLAAENPGHYFVFSVETTTVIAETDTQIRVPSDSRAESVPTSAEPQDFRKLLERAIAEPDRDSFLHILSEMKALIAIGPENIFRKHIA
jgi:hypothetical protein